MQLRPKLTLGAIPADDTDRRGPYSVSRHATHWSVSSARVRLNSFVRREISTWAVVFRQTDRVDPGQRNSHPPNVYRQESSGLHPLGEQARERADKRSPRLLGLILTCSRAPPVGRSYRANGSTPSGNSSLAFAAPTITRWGADHTERRLPRLAGRPEYCPSSVRPSCSEFAGFRLLLPADG